MVDHNIGLMWHLFHGRKHGAHCNDVTSSSTRESCSQTRNIVHTWRHVLPGLVPTVHAADAIVSPLPITSTDKMSIPPKIVLSDFEVQNYLAKETGRDRLRQMFKNEEKDQLSPELMLIVTCTRQTVLVSAFFAAVFGSRVAREEFVRTHQHTKFQTKFRALRAQQDAVFLGGIKTGAKWGLRTGIFSLIFLMTSQCISVYRNKTSVLEYMAGGCVTGSLLRMNLGLRGMFAGGVIGSVFGCVGGLAFYGIFRMSGQLQEQRHYWLIQEKLRKEKSFTIPGSEVVTEEEMKDKAPTDDKTS